MAGSIPKTTMRCHHCAGPLSKEMETSAWTVPPLIRDSFSMVLFLLLPTVSMYQEIYFVMLKFGLLMLCCNSITVQIGSAVGGTASAFYGFNYGNLFYICFSCFL